MARFNGIEEKLVSPERIEAIYGKDKSEKAFEASRDCSLKVTVHGASCLAHADQILTREASSAIDVQYVTKDEARVINYELEAWFADKEARDEAKNNLKSQPDVFSIQE